MTATIRDVAKHAGVGVGTVSRVINNRKSVSDATREKVLAAIEDLNYSPNLAARQLSTGRTMNIGVIAPFFTRQSVVERLKGIEAVLTKSPYGLNIFNVETKDRKKVSFREIPRRERIDGLLIITLVPDKEEVQGLLESEVPIVSIDAELPMVSNVLIDDVAGGMQATQHLIGLGHRKIGFVSGEREDELGNGSAIDRYTGYVRALHKAGIPFCNEFQLEGQHSRYAGYMMARQLLNLANPPTAIVASSDTHAMGVLRAAQETNINVPYELSIIGYDDIEVAEYINLTTIRQPLFESGELGTRLLLDELQTPSKTPNHIYLPTTVIVRGTTAVPRS